jgi:hypothetical protein
MSTASDVVRCKDCNQVVELDSWHQCVQTNKETLVQIGPNCVDKFYFDRKKEEIS